MKRTLCAVGLAALCLKPAPALAKKCPPDSVKVGQACVDTYEASVWQIPATNTSLMKKVQVGKVVLADLTSGGATEISSSTGVCGGSGGNFPSTFPPNGNWTAPLYAVSVAGVHPTVCVTWFQAAQACALSGKRLLTNQEWQLAAAGTPDPGTDNGSTDCNISAAGDLVNTGSRSNCKSSWGVFDMVGNTAEWVADWTDLANVHCTDWTTQGFTSTHDLSCFGGSGSGNGFCGGTGDTANIPGALLRGGGFFSFTGAGVFSVDAKFDPSGAVTFICDPTLGDDIGFRCGRNL